MNKIKPNLKCPYCSNSDTIIYFKANMPNILSACPKAILKNVKIFPFEARLCTRCLLGFNAAVLDDKELKFIYDNYLYISPMRGIGRTRFKGIITTLKKYYRIKDDIVEIGCSEGYLLNEIKKSGYHNLTGIEPGPQADEAIKLGLNIIKGYFNEDTFKGKIKDGFILSQVFEHFKNPFNILDAMKSCLSPTGKIVIEVPDFDGYHHQHLYFYNLPFFKKLFAEKGLKMVESVTEFGSLRVVVALDSNNAIKTMNISESSETNSIIKLSLEKRDKFKNSVSRLNNLLKKKKKIYWWGAGSSSVIYLNQIKRDILKNIDFTIVDGDEKKWGMYIPGLDLKVQPFSILGNKSLDLLIIASKFSDEINATCKNSNILVKDVEIFD